MPYYGSSTGGISGTSGTVCRAPAIAPLRGDMADHIEKPWEGDVSRKPWEWRVTAVIPHLDHVDSVKSVIATLRAQTERPYIMVIDTGSQDRYLESVSQLRAPDCEVHFMRPHAWRYTSQPVSVAMDMAFGLCQTEFCYGTHTDVFLRRADYIERITRLCGEQHPVVGYQMSPRTWRTALWSEMLSHTASVYHMPTMRRHGVMWNMDRALEMLGMDSVDRVTGWPDTEVCLSLILRSAGIMPRWLDDRAIHDEQCLVMIGNEENEPYYDGNLCHIRSTTVRSIYDRHRLRTSLLNSEISSARNRAKRWKVIPSIAWRLVGFKRQEALLM